MPAVSYRLPKDVRPERYQITLTPDLADFGFKGEETITIEILSPTSSIVLNSAGLHLQASSALLSDGTLMNSKDIVLDDVSETATISFDTIFQKGRLALNIEFSGILNDQLRGFYRGQYIGTDGNEHFLATTQFEATDARWAFPCWDEPNLKATFQVTLIVPNGLAAISNTLPSNDTLRQDGMRVIKFAETPRMSTYLLAFIVGDFASVEGTSADGTLVRVWAIRGKENHGQFALENAIRILDYLNRYFGIPYPLEKLDHIAIPDFAAGAMENWGAITYREIALLFDPENSAASTKQRIVEIIAHEMAHMWFGDLATMDWWDDLWLNESFASWMGDKAVDYLYPEWNMWTQFVYQDTGAGLNLDGLKNSHPIEARVQNPSEIRELFDAISYSKGASIIRMLEHFLGAEVFRRGLHSYLSTHMYANARTEDLWRALEDTSGQPVTDLMNSWVKQTGFPVIQVEPIYKDSDQKYQIELKLTQQRFLYEHLLGDDGDKTLWQVPVVISHKSTETVSVLLSEQSVVVEFPMTSQNDWFKVNAEQTGFYRVNYSVEVWNNFRTAIETQKLPPIDRLGLQSDAYALAKAGFIPATLFLSLAASYKDEMDATVWSDLSTSLRGLENLIVNESYLPEFYTYGQNLYREAAKKIGWNPRPNEEHLDALLRSTVLAQLGSYGDTEIIERAQGYFTSFVKDSSSLRPDIRALVLGLVGQEGDRGTYDQIWELEKQATLHEEKMRFLGALTRFKDPELLEETLVRSLSNEVRSQDTVSIIGAVAANRYGRDLAWDFIKQNWTEFDRRYGRGGFGIMRLVSTTGSFTTLERAEEVEKFFSSHPVPSAQRTIQQSLERIRISARWLEKNGPDLATWFAGASQS